MRTRFISLFVLCSLFCVSQNPKIDSLLTVLKTAKEDTSKVDNLNALGFAFYPIDPDTTILLAREAASLAQKINFRKGEANAYGIEGIGFWAMGDYVKALEKYDEALAIDEALNNKTGMEKWYGNIGIIYSNQGNYPQALEYYLRALKIAEETNNKGRIASWTGSIGAIYQAQRDYEKAQGYFFRAFKIAEQLNDKLVMTRNLTSIGLTYLEESSASKAGRNSDSLYGQSLIYFNRALKLAKEIGYKRGISSNFSNLGNAYNERKDYSKALDLYLQALKIDEEIHNMSGVAINSGNIGSIYLDTKKYKEAEKWLTDALAIDTIVNNVLHTQNTYELLSDLYENTGRNQLALEYYKIAAALKDTLFSQDKNKELTRKEMNYEFEKKETTAKAEQDKKDAVTRIVIYSVSAGFLIVLLLSGFIFKSYREKKKANEFITQQKNLVEEKQKEILDSIHYAKRIQESLLPTEKYIEKNISRLKKD